jgi:hypothetical protein
VVRRGMPALSSMVATVVLGMPGTVDIACLADPQRSAGLTLQPKSAAWPTALTDLWGRRTHHSSSL